MQELHQLHLCGDERLLEPMMRSTFLRRRGLTLIELMVVVAVAAVILLLAAPSFRDLILIQRLRAVNAQVVSDVAFARSEAISRGSFVQVRFQSTGGATGMSCYVIYSRVDRMLSPLCDCTAAAGSRCTDARTGEIRTVQLPNSESVRVTTASGSDSQFTLDPRTGGIVLPPSDLGIVPVDVFVVDAFIDGSRKFRDIVGQSGRVSVCAPLGSRVGVEPCV